MSKSLGSFLVEIGKPRPGSLDPPLGEEIWSLSWTLHTSRKFRLHLNPRPFATRFTFISRSLELFNDLMRLQEWALCYRKTFLSRCDRDLRTLLPFLCPCYTSQETETLSWALE